MGLFGSRPAHSFFESSLEIRQPVFEIRVAHCLRLSPPNEGGVCLLPSVFPISRLEIRERLQNVAGLALDGRRNLLRSHAVHPEMSSG
jgi:hypothetical protein